MRIDCHGSFFHRALAALRAIALRFPGLSFLARSLARATATGFFLRGLACVTRRIVRRQAMQPQGFLLPEALTDGHSACGCIGVQRSSDAVTASRWLIKKAKALVRNSRENSSSVGPAAPSVNRPPRMILGGRARMADRRLPRAGPSRSF